VAAGTQQRQRATLVNTRSRDTRQALIRAALNLWSEGEFEDAYEASTAGDIARTAGVSKGTFYFHFANKDAVLLEMSTGTTEAMVELVQAGARKGVSLSTLSTQMMGLMARRVSRAPKAAALRAATVGLTGRTDGQLNASPRLGVAFESLLHYGVESGGLDPQTDIAEGAAMLTAVSAEAIIRWGREDRSAAWLNRALRNRAAVVLLGIGMTATARP
jgi:AcrR family transcriptional regulator